MRSFAYTMLGLICLTLLGGCDRLQDSSEAIVGTWEELRGQTMIFDRWGRTVIKDRAGTVVASTTYTFEQSSGAVTVPLETGKLTGKLVGKKWLQMTSVAGRKVMLSRKG